jgi:hypothetical protein
MSDELKALQDTAEQARAKANELQAALTDASTDEEKAAAAAAEQAAVDAESAFADATAKAAAEAAAQGGDALPKAGDACICKDGRPGTVHLIGGETICLANQG